MTKNINEINKKIETSPINSYKNINNKELKFLYNFQIINNIIYSKLISNGYMFQEYLNNYDCYFLGNKKIFLFLNPDITLKEINYVNEIGYINNENCFIPEYILEFYEKFNLYKSLNNFFSTFFNSIIIDINNNNYGLLKNNKSIIGYCFKLNNNNVNNIEIYHKINLNNSSNIIEKELEKINEYEIQFDSYSCIKCNSQIELESILWDENSITYNCQNDECGNIKISINEFLKKILI